MGKDSFGRPTVELNGSVTLRIWDGIVRDFTRLMMEELEDSDVQTLFHQAKLLYNKQ